jgi:thioredoxin-related protein
MINLISCQNKVNIVFVGNLHDGFRIAREQDKKVLLVVGADGCGKCEKFLESISKGDEIGRSLERNFIVVYEENIKENIPRKITHCLATPMPFVFDKNGELLAFGYPKEKGKTFDDTEHVGMGKFDFQELIRLPVDDSEYKKMVGSCMRAYLCLKSTVSDNLIDSYSDLKESISIAPYCYNLHLAVDVAKKLNKPHREIEFYLRKMRDVITSMDRHIYADILLKELNLTKEELKEIDDSKEQLVKLSLKEVDFGKIKKKGKYKFSFELINKSEQPIIIHNIRASCSCVDLVVPKKPILPNATSEISGVFIAKSKGNFSRLLFIHTNSKQYPLKTFLLKGIVI